MFVVPGSVAAKCGQDLLLLATGVVVVAEHGKQTGTVFQDGRERLGDHLVDQRHVTFFVDQVAEQQQSVIRPGPCLRGHRLSGGVLSGGPGAGVSGDRQACDGLFGDRRRLLSGDHRQHLLRVCPRPAPLGGDDP